MESESMTTALRMEAVMQLVQMEKDPENRKAFMLGPFTAFTVIGALQLATRNPSITTKVRNDLQGVINTMISSFEGHPAHAVLLLGNDPANDVPRGPGEPE